ncbi:hypothetical protein HOP54_08850 [Halomonas daqingensis]|uniref:hypothetical protein n=1 Tax=Billgrantia desiderata TaxID=52021 RepID=UPI001F4853E4|nr:hypothetical protein [Halomonas desiderata]MCE8028796.1 hypothetical protein [Halomonas desiderata]
MSSRDEFTANTRIALAKSVGYACSICFVDTLGSLDSATVVSRDGRAAHICAAAEGGPRYRESMAVEERGSFENGIWLCTSHANEVDLKINEQLYPEHVLRGFKENAQRLASDRLGKPKVSVGYFSQREEVEVGYRFLNEFEPIYDVINHNRDLAHKFSEIPDRCYFLVAEWTVGPKARGWGNRSPLWSFNPELNNLQNTLISYINLLWGKIRYYNEKKRVGNYVFHCLPLGYFVTDEQSVLLDEVEAIYWQIYDLYQHLNETLNNS